MAEKNRGNRSARRGIMENRGDKSKRLRMAENIGNRSGRHSMLEKRGNRSRRRRIKGEERQRIEETKNDEGWLGRIEATDPPLDKRTSSRIAADERQCNT
ncbi:hypothetical protein SK128_020326, partial [Halocaridina rubra]